MKIIKLNVVFFVLFVISVCLFSKNVRISIVKGDNNVFFTSKYLRAYYSGHRYGLKKIEIVSKLKKLFVKKYGKLKRVSKVSISSRYPVTVNGKRYRGKFEIFIKNGFLYVVNIIDVESYLYGLIKSEILITSPPEALKAQAVVARTFAINHLGKHKNEGFDLCNTTHCQVYRGISGEDPRSIRAVNDTRGEIITYKGNAISAFYSSNCGGLTCSNNDAWGGKQIPYLVSVKDPYCFKEYGFKWEYKILPNELKKILNIKGYNVGTPVDIVILKRNSSNRVFLVKVIGTKGEASIKGKELRRILGYKNIKSENFIIKKIKYSNNIKDSIKYAKEKLNIMKIIREAQKRKKAKVENYFQEDNKKKIVDKTDKIKMILSKIESRKKKMFKFSGFGYGHGVGMCQSGARAMAKKGKRYIDIIRFYYNGVKIKKIY